MEGLIFLIEHEIRPILCGMGWLKLSVGAFFKWEGAISSIAPQDMRGTLVNVSGLARGSRGKLGKAART